MADAITAIRTAGSKAVRVCEHIERALRYARTPTKMNHAAHELGLARERVSDVLNALDHAIQEVDHDNQD